MENKKVKAAFCFCEKGIFYVAALPYAETETHCVRQFARYARQGHRIDYVEVDEVEKKFYKCDCYKTKKNSTQEKNTLGETKKFP